MTNSGESVQPLFLPTKADAVYSALYKDILSCRLAPGAVINQADLAERLRVSTTPLREALRRLASEGLVRLGAYRDAIVSPLSPDEARQLFEVRVAFDPVAARLAASRSPSTHLAAIERILRELEPISGGVSDEGLAKHRELHSLIYRASGNDILAAILEGLWDRTDRYRHFELGRLTIGERRYEDFHEHDKIVEAIRKGDEEMAASLSRGHVERSLARLALDRLSADDDRGLLPVIA